MTIDLVLLDSTLDDLINDPRIPSEYQSRLKALKHSIDPSKRFNLSELKDPGSEGSEPIAQGSLESDTLAHAVDSVYTLYVGLRDAHLRTDPDRVVEYKRPGDTEGGNAD
jgi:hypothetical protein